MSDGTNNSPVEKSDVFKDLDEPLSIKFITNSMIAIGIAVFLMMYIIVIATRDSFSPINGNERVDDMIAEAKQLDSSVNKPFLAVATKALVDNRVSSSEMALIEAERKIMTDKRGDTLDQELTTATEQ